MAIKQSHSSRLEGGITSDPLGISTTGILFLPLALSCFVINQEEFGFLSTLIFPSARQSVTEIK